MSPPSMSLAASAFASRMDPGAVRLTSPVADVTLSIRMLPETSMSSTSPAATAVTWPFAPFLRLMSRALPAAPMLPVWATREMSPPLTSLLASAFASRIEPSALRATSP